jgi:hypothetical protein
MVAPDPGTVSTLKAPEDLVIGTEPSLLLGQVMPGRGRRAGPAERS